MFVKKSRNVSCTICCKHVLCTPTSPNHHLLIDIICYIINLFPHICLSAIAGQTAGPNWLFFLENPYVCPASYN